MRVLLLAGKGGVGKTTMAAATAVAAARSGVKTLVVSTDPAHSLGDCLALDLSSGLPVEVEPGLAGLHIDTRGQLAQGWAVVQAYLAHVLGAVGLDPVEAAELAALSGAEDVLSLLALTEQVEGGSWDLVVVDAAPTAETLRLLSLPDALLRVVTRMLPRDGLMARLTAPVIAGSLPRPDRQVEQALVRLRQSLLAALEVLRAPTTSVRLVLTPEAVVLAEARRLFTALAVHGYTVDGVLANRVVPAGGDDVWRNGWAQAQAAVLAEADDSFDPVPVRRVPYLGAEPVGVQALAALADSASGRAPGQPAGASEADDLLAAPTVRPVVEVRTVPGGFELVLPAPLTRARDVAISRDGDDLWVRIGAARRAVSLPSVLHRCRATGARVARGSVLVRFEPDPALLVGATRERR